MRVKELKRLIASLPDETSIRLITTQSREELHPLRVSFFPAGSGSNSPVLLLTDDLEEYPDEQVLWQREE